MTADYARIEHRVRDRIHQVLGRSLAIRQVDAGSCNGCELELNALSNVNFDIGRFGIDFATQMFC